jgi:hypothetical protein
MYIREIIEGEISEDYWFQTSVGGIRSVFNEAKSYYRLMGIVDKDNTIDYWLKNLSNADSVTRSDLYSANRDIEEIVDVIKEKVDYWNGGTWGGWAVTYDGVTAHNVDVSSYFEDAADYYTQKPLDKCELPKGVLVEYGRCGYNVTFTDDFPDEIPYETVYHLLCDILKTEINDNRLKLNTIGQPLTESHKRLLLDFFENGQQLIDS